MRHPKTERDQWRHEPRKSGQADLVKSNLDRFHPFPKPQVVGPIPTEGAKWKWGIPTGTRCGHPRFGDSFGLWFTAAITLYRRSTWRRVTPALRVIPSDVFVFLSRELSSAGTRERCIVPVSDSNKSAINNVRTDNSRGRPDLGLWALIFSSITTANAELPDK